MMNYPPPPLHFSPAISSSGISEKVPLFLFYIAILNMMASVLFGLGTRASSGESVCRVIYRNLKLGGIEYRQMIGGM